MSVPQTEIICAFLGRMLEKQRIQDDYDMQICTPDTAALAAMHDDKGRCVPAAVLYKRVEK